MSNRFRRLLFLVIFSEIFLCGCSQRLVMGRLISEADLSRLSYGATSYSDVIETWGSPDSIIIKDGYLLATWKGAGVEGIGVSLNGGNSLIGTTAEGTFRNTTLIFDSGSKSYIKYIIDTDPLTREEWITKKGGVL